MNLTNCASAEEADKIFYITHSTQDCFTWYDDSQCMKYIHIYVSCAGAFFFKLNREQFDSIFRIHIDCDSIGFHAHGDLEAFKDAWRMYSIFTVCGCFNDYPSLLQNHAKNSPLNDAGVVLQ